MGPPYGVTISNDISSERNNRFTLKNPYFIFLGRAPTKVVQRM